MDPKPPTKNQQEKPLNQRLEEGEFDQRVTEMIAHLGLAETTKSLHMVDLYTKAATPENLHLAASDILQETKLSTSVNVAQAQVASLETQWRKELPNENSLEKLLESFDRFYLEPTEENHQDFLEKAKEVEQALDALKQNKPEEEQEKADKIENALTNFTELEEDLYKIAKQELDHNEQTVQKKAGESVKRNAEIQGVEKARDVMTDTISQQVQG